jgi:hypothetical protein
VLCQWHDFFWMMSCCWSLLFPLEEGFGEPWFPI